MDCPKKLLKFSSSWESCFLFLRITGPTPCVEAIIACADGYAHLLTDIESYLCFMPLTSLLTQNFKINMYKIFITWRSFRIDCDPVSETWWWSAEEDPEVFQLFLMHKRILCHASLSCIFTNFLTNDSLILCRTLTAVGNRWVSMSILTNATCTMSAQARAG